MNAQLRASFILVVLALAIFLAGGAFFYSINALSSDTMFPDDVFYHVAHARSYLTGEALSYPIYSMFSEKPADLYLGYHYLMALFIGSGEALPEAMLWRVQVMQSVLAGIFLSLFFLVSSEFMRFALKVPPRTARWLGLLTTVLLVTFSASFMFRLFIVRPHIISSLFFLLAFLFSVKRWHLPLFLTSILFPLLYPLSFLVLIPPLIIAFCDLLGSGFRPKSLSFLSPFLIALGGLAIGIVLHPDSLNYLYNGYFATVVTLLTSKLGITMEGREISSPLLSLYDLSWLIPLIAAWGAILVRFMRHPSFTKTLSLPLAALLVMVSSLFILQMFFARTSEYFFPFWALLVVFVFASIYRVGVSVWLNGEGGNTKPSGHSIRAVLEDMHSDIIRNKKLLSFLLILVFLFQLSGIWLFLARTRMTQSGSDRYTAAAHFIADDSPGGSIVFTQYFHQYPPLVFFNPSDRYIMGMASVYTYLYNRELYWQYLHVIKGEAICLSKKCRGEGADLYETLRTAFGASYVFIDTERAGGKEKATPEFIALLDNDTRFKKVFVDEKYPSVMLYKL